MSVPPLLVDDELSSELGAVNALWTKGDHSAATLTRAAHALTSVVFEMVDPAGPADAVVARAWALQALARAAGGGVAGDEALLAWQLGYARAARELGRGLPADDPVRAFVLDDGPKLASLAAAPGASSGLRYLWILGAGGVGATALAQFPEYDSGDSSQAFMGAFARHGLLDIGDTALKAALLELRDVRAAGSSPGLPSPEALDGHVLNVFDQALAALPEQAGGVPYDTSLQRLAARARFYGALTEVLDLSIRMRGIPKEGDDLIRWLGRGSSAESAQLRTWFQTLVSTTRPYRNDAINRALAVGWPRFGAVASDKVLEVLFMMAESGTPPALDAARLVIPRLSSRPDHLEMFGRLAKQKLANKELAQRCFRRALPMTGDRTTALSLADLDGDYSESLKTAADPVATAAQHVDAIFRLFEGHRLTADDAAAQLRHAAQTDPTPTSLHQYVAWLRNQKRYEEEKTALEPWMAAHPDDESLEAGGLRAALATALRETGHPKEAWALLEPIMEGSQGSVLFEGALTLLALNRRAEALTWARKYFDRYDNATGDPAATYATVLWRAGEYTTAARALSRNMNPDNWEDFVADQFAEAFQHRSAAEATAAIEALLPVERPEALQQFALGLARVKLPELAVMLASRLPRATAGRDVMTYVMLNQAKGPSYAATWLRKRQPDVSATELGRLAYAHGADDALFALADSYPDSAITDRLWLLQAALLVRRKIHSGPHLDRIHAHFASVPADDPARHAGRFLFGLETEAEFVASATTPEKMSAAAYYLGVAAEGAGHIEEAAEHYRDALEFRNNFDYEVWFSQMQLRLWNKNRKSLKLIAAEGL